MLDIAKIRTDGGTQARAAIQDDTVAEYAEAMQDENTVFPPVIVYYDGKHYWLADGFHRLAAWVRTGRVEVPADVRQGDRRRAILHSVAANSDHGLRRSNADKRRAVMTLLEDDEWSGWTDSEIARRCGVSQPFVSKLRGEASSNGYKIPTERTVHRGGTTYQQNTANIGKAEPADDTQKQERSEPANTTDGSGEEGGLPPLAPPDPDAEARRSLAKLTREGLEDELIGLRAENAEQRSQIMSLKSERDDYKAKWQEATEGEIGRALGNAQRRATTAEGRMKEHMRIAKRLEYQLKKMTEERDQARRQIESHEVAL